MCPTPKFSVIMPSFLGEYKNCASNRDEKIVRAVKSVLKQDDFELIIIADGCDKTIEIISDNFNDSEIKLFRKPFEKVRGSKRNAGSSGRARNAGLQNATGEYAIYLDTDDFYSDGYLESLKAEMTDHSWYWMDNLSFNESTGVFDRYVADINEKGRCGTSNVCHKLSMNAFWTDSTDYLHDWIFINILKSISPLYKKLDVAGYGVCHVPNLLDV